MNQEHEFDYSEQAVRIPAGDLYLEGDLVVPSQPLGAILFAHGSGSGRHSPRNRSVASALNRDGLATLLVDLLTEEEEYEERHTRHLRFDIGLLAGRLRYATDWLAGHSSTGGLAIGYFGASTGAGAALLAASSIPGVVGAVVSRGGRPDLASYALFHVRSPTLLIVGGRDQAVIALNRNALERLRCEKRLEIVPGASHLFEEPGALETVANLAGRWFREHLAGQPGGGAHGFAAPVRAGSASPISRFQSG